MQGLPSWSCGFTLQLVQLMERFSVFFLSHSIPRVQLWFYPHLCVWFTHRSLVLRLPWSSWVCPCEYRAQRWYDSLDGRSSGSTKCTGKQVAMGARDMALVRAFSGAWHKAHEGQHWPAFFWHRQQAYKGQPWGGIFFFYCPAAGGVWGPALRGLYFIARQPAHKSQPWGGFFYCCRQVLARGEREATIVAPPPACDSAVAPCFHGSPVSLHRHSLLHISSLSSPQSVSPQPTAVLSLGLFSNPHTPAPSPLAHLWTHIAVWGT